jgi:hypothetical protein
MVDGGVAEGSVIVMYQRIQGTAEIDGYCEAKGRVISRCAGALATQDY